jgi:hypothetical protein
VLYKFQLKRMHVRNSSLVDFCQFIGYIRFTRANAIKFVREYNAISLFLFHDQPISTIDSSIKKFWFFKQLKTVVLHLDFWFI